MSLKNLKKKMCFPSKDSSKNRNKSHNESMHLKFIYLKYTKTSVFLDFVVVVTKHLTKET